ncbi:hypothetical protein [Candidatus Uabimicrobium sp. HlEnr_7]|uniref:hypothetical protein n=1 Tax=Candidatus Uabimicrobium helgolandensis TaxID=3095367 RepID=UPI0035572C04
MLDTIDTIIIALAVDDNQSLFILLSKNGAIQCMGDGSVNNQDKTIYIGTGSTEFFQKLKEHINPLWLKRCGRYSVPQQRGNKCELSIVFRAQKQEKGIQFIYGANSQGPPPDITNFIHIAVNLITPWHQKQQKKIEGAT